MMFLLCVLLIIVNVCLMPFTCMSAAITGGQFILTLAGHTLVMVLWINLWKHYFYRAVRPDLNPRNYK